MTHTLRESALDDHYTVISHDTQGQTCRIVIACSAADAAETHREHYPRGAIVRVFGN